jgi:UDP-N-acetylglucosamine transferase subunit ALG13
MIRVVDDWARAERRTDVFAQIGRTEWRPSFIPFAPFLEPAEFGRCFAGATAVIAHAGMGTILSALRFEKPILVMPRRAALGEHRNDHQLATAQRLVELGKIHVALDERELLDHLANLETLQARAHTGDYAAPALLAAIREFVHRGEFAASAAAKIGAARELVRELPPSDAVLREVTQTSGRPTSGALGAPLTP